MKGFFNKMTPNKNSQDNKNAPLFPDPAMLEEIIKKQLIEKNPKLLADKSLLEETIRKAFKEKNLLPKGYFQQQQNVNIPPPPPPPLINKFENQPTVDLLDIGIINDNNSINPTESNKINNTSIIMEPKEKVGEEKNYDQKENESIISSIKPLNYEKIDKSKINEEIKIKYSFLLQPHQFKFESNKELLNELHKKLTMNKEKQSIEIDKEFILKILDNLEYLRKCQIENRELEEKYKNTVKDYKKMQERLTNQEDLLKKIEFTYHEKINEKDYSFQEKINSFLIENKNLKNIIEKHERNLAVQTETFKEEITQYQEKLKNFQIVIYFIKIS